MSSRQGAVEIQTVREKKKHRKKDVTTLVVKPFKNYASMCGVIRKCPSPVFQPTHLQKIMERSRGLRTHGQMS